MAKNNDSNVEWDCGVAACDQAASPLQGAQATCSHLHRALKLPILNSVGRRGQLGDLKWGGAAWVMDGMVKRGNCSRVNFAAVFPHATVGWIQPLRRRSSACELPTPIRGDSVVGGLESIAIRLMCHLFYR